MKLQFIFLSASVLLHHAVFGVEETTVSVMEGDFVTLHIGVKTNQQHRIRWYFNGIRIAQITGDLRKTCKDNQCDERFRDRLEMDDQTGSLTITNIRTSDAGLYKLKILGSYSSEKIFNVTVHDRKSTVTVKKRESVTLCPGVVNPDDVMIWYFNDSFIAEINGHRNETCTDDQCKEADERFRDRLELDQTGSLTITDTRITDSGVYKLLINSSSSWIVRSFKVTVTDSHAETPDTKAVFAGVVPLVLIVAVGIGVFYLCSKHKQKYKH